MDLHLVDNAHPVTEEVRAAAAERVRQYARDEAERLRLLEMLELTG